MDNVDRIIRQSVSAQINKFWVEVISSNPGAEFICIMEFRNGYGSQRKWQNLFLLHHNNLFIPGEMRLKHPELCTFTFDQKGRQDV